MARTVTMTATEAELFIRTLRTPKEGVRFSDSKVRRHGRIYKAILKADKENGFFVALDGIMDEMQEQAQKEAAATDGSNEALTVVNNRINNGALAVEQKELRKAKGITALSFSIDSADYDEVKKDWESREWGAMNAETEATIVNIGESLDGATKE